MKAIMALARFAIGTALLLSPGLLVGWVFLGPAGNDFLCGLVWVGLVAMVLAVLLLAATLNRVAKDGREWDRAHEEHARAGMTVFPTPDATTDDTTSSNPGDRGTPSDFEPDENHSCGGPAEACMIPGCSECGTPSKIMKKQYAVACSMATNNGSNYLHTTTLHINEAVSLEEAKGLSIDSAMEMKPGFAVTQVVAAEIPRYHTSKFTDNREGYGHLPIVMPSGRKEN